MYFWVHVIHKPNNQSMRYLRDLLMINDKQLNKYIGWKYLHPPPFRLPAKSERLPSKYIELTKTTRIAIKLSISNKPVINYLLIARGIMIISSCKCCTTDEIQLVKKKKIFILFRNESLHRCFHWRIFCYLIVEKMFSRCFVTIEKYICGKQRK